MGVPSVKGTLTDEALEAPQRSLPWQFLTLPRGDTGESPSANARSPALSLGSAVVVTPKASIDDPTAEKLSGIKRALTLFTLRKAQQPDSTGFDEGVRGLLGLHLLHESPKPLVELIFVHGLRGGSIKTWRKGEKPGLFWPKSFLPNDPHIPDASIYSFGYNSDWGSSKHSALDVHDFGNGLLEAMRTSPHLRNRTNNLNYAASFFSHHVYAASSEADKLVITLYTVLTTNGQTWINHVACKGDLHCLLQTARGLRGHLNGIVQNETLMAKKSRVRNGHVRKL